jgi:hypothetical protein
LVAAVQLEQVLDLDPFRDIRVDPDLQNMNGDQQHWLALAIFTFSTSLS